jgi:hypothetical protein
MNNLFYISPSQLKNMYHTIYYSKSKDKLDMVLEPLQAMVQIALLSISPIGTKLTIQENILYIQSPSIGQSFNRWYNSSKKDDLFYLFQVIRRFIKWYNPNNSKLSPLTLELYQLIIKMAINGFDNLLKTYNSCESNTIGQVINIYRNLLQSVDHTDVDKIFNEKGINMDEVFENIVKLYDPNVLNIIYNTLLIVEKETNENNVNDFINGLNFIMTKNNNQIQNWIKNNLIL